MAGAPVVILCLDKNHTQGKADERSGRSLGPSDFVNLTYQLYLQCYLSNCFVFLLYEWNLIPINIYASW